MRLFYLCVAMLVVGGLAGCQQESSTPKKTEVASDVVVAPKAAPAERVEKRVEPVVEKVVETVKEKTAVTPPVEAAMKEPEKAVEAATEVAIKQSAPVVVEKPIEPVVVSKPAALGDVAKGAKLTKGKCKACHSLDQAKKKVGPTLMGIYGQAPSIDGVPFAVWDVSALDAWLESPKAVKPKTKMAFKGIPEKAKRDDIIAYLKTL